MSPGEGWGRERGGQTHAGDTSGGNGHSRSRSVLGWGKDAHWETVLGKVE